MRWNEIIRKQEPSEEECLEAISQNVWSIREMRNPGERVLREAVKKNPFVLEAVQEQTEEICLIALRDRNAAKRCYGMIHIPFTERMKESLLESSPETAYEHKEELGIRFDPEEKENLFLLMSLCPGVYKDDVPEEVMREFLERDGMILRGYTTDSKELQWVAIRNNPKAISCIRNPDPEMIRYVLKKNDYCLNLLKNKYKFPFTLTEEYLFLTLSADTKELSAKEILEEYRGGYTEELLKEVLRQRINEPCDEWLYFFQNHITPDVVDYIIEHGNPKGIQKYMTSEMLSSKNRLKNLLRRCPESISSVPEKYLSCSMFLVAARASKEPLNGYFYRTRFRIMKVLCRMLFRK